MSTESTVRSDTWEGYTGIVVRGYVHRLVNHGDHLYSNGNGNHINGLEGFRGYLKRKLTSKSEIHQERIHLFLESTSGDIAIDLIQKKFKVPKINQILERIRC